MKGGTKVQFLRFSKYLGIHARHGQAQYVGGMIHLLKSLESSLGTVSPLTFRTSPWIFYQKYITNILKKDHNNAIFYAAKF